MARLVPSAVYRWVLGIGYERGVWRTSIAGVGFWALWVVRVSSRSVIPLYSIYFLVGLLSISIQIYGARACPSTDSSSVRGLLKIAVFEVGMSVA